MSQLMNTNHLQSKTSKKIQHSANCSNLSSLLNQSVNEKKNVGIEIQQHSDLVSRRYHTETSGITYSGYLLKRSNQPYHPNRSTATASIDDSLPLPDLGSHSSESIYSSGTIPFLQVTRPQRRKSDCGSHVSQFRDVTKGNGKFNDHVINAIRCAASFFGYLPNEPTFSQKSADSSSKSSIEEVNTSSSSLPQKIKSSPISTPTNSKPVPIVCPTSFAASEDSVVTEGKTMRNNQNDMAAGYGGKCKGNSFITSDQKKSQDCDDSIPPPPDQHDLKDGHIWRAKYCILENGVLYFYCNAKDGNSPEAQKERDKLIPFSNDFDGKDTSGGVVEKSSVKSSMNSDLGSFEVDHLAKSPMPRNYFSTFSTPRDTTEGVPSSTYLDSTNVIWEKRVVLHRVGSVLASEDFGDESFILRGINRDDDNAVDTARNMKNPSRTLDKKACTPESSLEDRLILRAASPDDMRNWIFEIHKSLQIIVNKIVRNKATLSGKKGSRYSHFASEGRSSHIEFGKCMSYSPTPQSNPSIRTTLSLELQTTGSMDLSHSHCRSDLLWHPTGNESNILVPRVIPGKDSLLAPFAAGDHKIIYDRAPTYLVRSSAILEYDRKQMNSGNLLEPNDKMKEIKSERKNDKVASNLVEAVEKQRLQCSKPKKVGKYLPPQRRGGKYVPPHRRQKGAGVRKPMESPSDKSIFRVKCDDTTNLRLEGTKPNQLHTENGHFLSTEYCNEKEDLLSSPCHNDAPDAPINSSTRLGGCADPTLIEGSICDLVYRPKRASVVGKDNSKPYGSSGGISAGCGRAGQTDNIRWEIGAVSIRGIRSSNEDAYLILNDFFSDTTTDQSASIFKRFQSHGIFAIFDGHCGNHTARFAAEKFPSILLDESMKDDFLKGNGNLTNDDQLIQRLLKSTLIRLDREFCEMCTTNGREWNSGATALVAMVVGNKLVVAGLGDSNGVLCCTTSRDSGMQEDGWKNLTEVQPNACNTRQEANIIWKNIVQTHNPSREDERKRVEDANGWITTETEILCSQIERVNWNDYDVIDLVGRSSRNGHAGVSRILTISRVCGDLAVSRALGDREYKAAYNILPTEAEAVTEVALDEEASPIEWESDVLMKDRRFKGDLISSLPEINLFNLGGGKTDEFLLLACDGLWDVMDAIDAVRITRNLLFEKQLSTKDSADRLAELAYGLGSSDNITVIVVLFRGE